MVCAQAKENEAASLSCPEGQAITAVTFASYGTPQGVCGSLALGACHAASSQQQVEQACLGKPSCAVSATNAAFGDPCENTVKGLSVEASCGPGSGGEGGAAGQGGAGGGGSSGSSGQAGAGGGGSSGASGQGGAPDCPCFECPGTPPPPSQTFDEGELLVTHQGTPITAHYFEGILYATASWPGMTCDSPGCFVPGSPGLCDLLSSNGYPAKDDCQSFAMEDPRKGWKPPVYQAKTYCDGEIIGGCDYPVQVRVKDEKGYIRLLKPDETVWSVDGGYMVNTNCGLPFHWRCFLNGVGTDEQLGLGAPCLP